LLARANLCFRGATTVNDKYGIGFLGGWLVVTRGLPIGFELVKAERL
jgi:hypothetical protein